MSDKRLSPLSSIRVAALMAAVLILTACALPPDYWPTPGFNKTNQVDWVVDSHEFHFVPGTAMPKAGEHDRLAAFLRAVEADDAARIFVDAERPGTAEALAARREATTDAYVARLGFDMAQPPADAERERAVGPRVNQDSVTVVVGRYLVTPPDCPDFRKPMIGDYTNLPSTNFGCATATNLGLMVANPQDLIRGQSMGPADGERASQRIRQYRSGKLPALEQDGKKASTTSPGAALGESGGAS